MTPVAALLLAVALLPLGQLLFARRRRIEGRRYPRMVRTSWLRFGVPPLVLLGSIARWPDFLHLPSEFAAARMLLGIGDVSAVEQRILIGAAAIGVAIGVGGGMLLTAWRAWRGRPEGTLFGDAAAVRPGPGELGWAAALAVTAGITEEAYFRLLLPLLATLAMGSAPIAFVGAALLFGAAHRYQGWRGMLATTLAGAALSVFYLASGSLIAAMAVHATGDLGHLVLRPAVRGWIERRRSKRR